MKKFLSLLLIPYLLVFINSKYVLEIDNTPFEFTLEENDVAKEFKTKFPLTITMYPLGDYIRCDADGFLTTSFDSPEIRYQPGYIDVYNDGDDMVLYIRLNDDFENEKNIGKIKEPKRLKELFGEKYDIKVLFTE